MKSKKNNLAFIDGQNLYLGTAQHDWKIDYKKFRVYLKDKYCVNEAYYVLGYISEDLQDLYNNLQKAPDIFRKFAEYYIDFLEKTSDK